MPGCILTGDSLVFGHPLPVSQNAAMLPDPKPASAAQGFPLPEVLITVLYLVLATGWIIGSDAALERMAGYPEESAPLQTLKGLNFVVTTSAMLYLLLRRLYTRRRQAEQMVREQAERFELVARAASDLLWDIDLKADRVWWSPGFAASFGEPPQGLGPTLEGWYRCVHPEDRDRVRMGVEAALAPAGSRSWSHQYRFQRSDGSYATVVGRGWVEAGEDGTAIRIVGGITDVTARVEAERELRRSREQLRALSVRLQTLREDERTHIAREIHDELGQLLTGLRMNLRWAEDQLAAGVAGLALNSVLDRVVEATELTDHQAERVR